MRLRLIFKTLITQIEAFFDRLRARIPGLPGNRAIFAVIGLAFAVLILFAALQVLLAPKQKYTTYTLPYEQTFEQVDLTRWFVGDGVWTIRDAALSQTVGGDKPAQVHIPLKMPDATPYHASVYITLKKDTRAAGMSFNAQYPNLTSKQQRVYLSRPDKDTLALVAGYMDDTGSFVTQVQVPLSVNTTEFRLDVYVYDKTYLVQLNGQRMIEDRPLFYTNGLIGFYALGPAIFDTFNLTAADNPNPGNLVYTSDFDQLPGAAGWVPFAGTWKIANKQLVQTDPIIINAGMGYETSSFQNFTLRATFNHISGQGAGVLFNMPSPYDINGAQIVRYSDETDSIIWGFFDAKGAFNRQGFVAAQPAGTEPHTLKIFSGDSSYDVFLDETIIVRGVPLQSKQGNIGVLTSGASAGFSLVEVFPLFGAGSSTPQPLTPAVPLGSPTAQVTAVLTKPVKSTPAPASPSPQAVLPKASPAATLAAVIGGQSPYNGVFTGKLADQNWAAISGNWSFQNGNFVQQRQDGYDYSAVYTLKTFKNFSYQVGLTHLQNSGAGLLFNMSYPDRLTGASMVRYSDKRDNAIVWGYFDDNGVYKNQGYAEVNHAGTDHHTLRVISGDKSYAIYLDDRLVVQSVPFGSRQNYGYIGLLTSMASVSYDEVSLAGVGAAFKGNYTTLDGFTDQRIVSGKWTVESNKITQTVPDTADYVWNTGVQASQYTISANISLPKGSSTAGAGFIINMAERGTKNNAFIVRLTKGGQGLWWGSTDENGKFIGQGSAVLSPGASTFLVKVVVDSGKMSVFVDDKQIAANIPTSGVEGWVGLVAYGGPVTFQNVKLDVTQ